MGLYPISTAISIKLFFVCMITFHVLQAYYRQQKIFLPYGKNLLEINRNFITEGFSDKMFGKTHQ